MDGAQSVIATAVDAGVEVCFANPGTTEMTLVAALEAVPGMRSVLCLQENVATGAADAYARVHGKPALALLHLGPGLANGLANLHNARKGRSPVVALVGENATWHQQYESGLASDIDTVARPMSGWVGRTSSAAAAAAEFAEALAATTTDRRPATLILASDHQWDEAAGPATVPAVPPRPTVDEAVVDTAAKALAGAGTAALLVGGDGLTGPASRLVDRIATATGCRAFRVAAARAERGGGLPDLPLVAALNQETVDELVLVGTPPPVSLFGFRGEPSSLVPDGASVTSLASPDEDVVDALERLAERTSAVGTAGALASIVELPAELPTGPLTPDVLATVVAALQPEGAIVVNEAVTSGGPYQVKSAAARRHTMIQLTGGAIGWGIPASVGAAVAAPDRQVIDLQADGSGLYTVQGLWTQARESLNVTTVVCSNRRYSILDGMMRRVGITEAGPVARSLTDLGNPAIDWTAVAGGFGVPATRATTGAELADALRRALAEPGPHLVEAVL